MWSNLIDMKSLIEQEQKSISGLWEKPLYIPIYQREFVWEDEQIENAVRTIFDDKEDEIESYMGNILLVYKENKFYEIVDGQQRMTFSFILIKSIYELLQEIKDLIPSEDENVDFVEDVIKSTLKNIEKLLVVDQEERLGDNHRPRIFYASEKLNANITSLLNGIVDGVKNPDGRVAIVKMQKKLKSLIATSIITSDRDGEGVSAKKYDLPKNVNEVKKVGRELRDLYEYVTRNVKYIEVKLNDEKYATEVFERMNSTSKPLTDYELFKNYIAGELIKNNIKDVEGKINDIDDIVNDDEVKLDTTSIIRSLLYLKEGKVTSSKYKFDKLKKIYKSLHNPKQMYKEVKSLIQTYSDLENLSVSDEKQEILLPYIIIKTYNLKQLRPAIIAMLHKHGYSDELKELFMLLISIVFKRVVFNGEVANVIESLLYRVFHDGNDALDKPEKIIERIKADSAYSAAVEAEINQKTFNSIQKNEFTKVMWIYEINKNFGSVNILTNSTKSDIKINYSALHVEHILPRSWEDNWSDIVGEMEEIERKELIDNPGNKIPILGEYNIKASNKSFKDKKERHYVYSSFNNIENDDLNSKDKWVISTGMHFDMVDESEIWNKEKIEERSEKLKNDFIIEIEKYLI